MSRLFRTLSPLSRYYHSSSLPASKHAVVDLRSDVLTKPSKSMLDAMVTASYGDDVFSEDPTVDKLQKYIANEFGMDRALLVPSGTMGNLICVLAHCHWARSLEVILGDKSHVVMYEQGGISVLGGVHCRQIPNNPDGTFDLDSVDELIRPHNDPHQPFTAMVGVENTHNVCGGRVLPLEFLKNLKSKCVGYELPLHMDGARLMNAAVALNVPVKTVLKDIDSVNMCFSKGVGTPIGSIIAGTDEFIERAIRLRKMLGGGWRQPGPIAAAALVAMEDVTERMKIDHQNAKRLAKEIQANNHGVVNIDVDGVETNIIMIDIIKPGLDAQQFCTRLGTVSDADIDNIEVRATPFSPTLARFVVYSNITAEQVEMAIDKTKLVIEEFANTEM